MLARWRVIYYFNEDGFPEGREPNRIVFCLSRLEAEFVLENNAFSFDPYLWAELQRKRKGKWGTIKGWYRHPDMNGRHHYGLHGT